MGGQKSFVERYFAGKTTTFDEALWNNFVREVDARYRELEGIKVDWEAVSDQGIQVALDRINEVLLPASDRIRRVAELGFLVAPSTTAHTLEEGETLSFIVSEGDQRDLFTPSPFVAITRGANATDYAIGRALFYNPVSGQFDVRIDAVFGNPGPHSDWFIAAVAGSVSAQVELLADAQTARTGAETARTGAETARTGAETAKTAAETAQTNAQTARSGAEAARTGAETAQTAAQTARTGAETARTGAETARTGAEAAKTAAETLLSSVYSKTEADQRFVTGKQSQVFTDAEKGRARGNIDLHILSGHRNKLINGDLDICQRATIQTTSGYGSFDRWINTHIGSTKTTSRQNFNPGQIDVPGNPQFFSRTIVTSVAGASNCVFKGQRIEDVGTLAGETSTLTFWAKADANKNMAFSFNQYFGTGGSPSATVVGIAPQKIALTTLWQKFSFAVSIPSISGKVLGSDGNHRLELFMWFDAGSDFNSRTNNLGQQSGTFDVAHISLVAGDATSERDPFSRRHFIEEVALCYRYFWRNMAGENLMQGHVSGAGGGVFMSIRHPILMRGQPAMAATFSTSGPIGTPVLDRINPRTFAIGATGTGSGAYSIEVTSTISADAEL